jgi:hypothetical protein
MPAVGGAIACYTKALEFRNGKYFQRVAEEGYSIFKQLRKISSFQNLPYHIGKG